MKILAVADEEEASLWDYYSPRMTEGVDLIIGCGDLKAKYLEFLTTVVNQPLLYLPGNHDQRYVQDPPEGGIDIDGQVYDFHGLRILGLGGSRKYRNGPFMYTEAEMKKRIAKLDRSIRFMNGIDVVVAHAPVKGYGDLEDLPHQGFDCFNDLLMKYHPQVFLHGHVHQAYTSEFQREREHPSGTRLINCGGHVIIDIPEGSYPEEGHTGSRFYDWYVGWKKKR